ncbi:MAG: hypothetical protein AAGD33_11395 [Actinomycetota bacterium]
MATVLGGHSHSLSRRLVGAAIVASVAVACGGSGDGDAIDTAAAAAALDSQLARSAATGEAVVDVDCPFAGGRGLLRTLFAEIDDPEAASALEGDFTAVYVDDPNGEYVACDAFARDADPAVGIAVLPAPDDVTAYIEAFYSEGAEIAVEGFVDEGDDFAGGSFSRSCASASFVGGLPTCEVHWSNGELFITTYVASSQAMMLDLGPVEERLRAQLPELIDQLASI